MTARLDLTPERELAHILALIQLSPDVRAAIEADVEGANPGDIEQGRLVPFHIGMMDHSASIEIGYYLGDDPEFRSQTVPLLDSSDIEEIAFAFSVLAEWAGQADAP